MSIRSRGCIFRIMHIHPSAIVDDGASIGAETRIWHWTHVCAGAIIGNGCSLGQNVFVGATARIGSNVKIQNNVSVYDDVIIEDDVFCGPSVVFTNVYNPRATVSRKAEYRATRIGRGATLGANCTIVCGVTIGRFAFVAAGAVVNRDVPDYALMAGVPARRIGWMSEYGERLSFPEAEADVEATATCPGTGLIYAISNGKVARVD